jgi:hypothetical protein
VDGDADRHGTAGRDDSVRDETQRSVPLDPKHRDVVAAGIHGDHEAAVSGELNRTLRRETRPGSLTTRDER